MRDEREYTVTMRDEGGCTEESTLTIPAGTEADQDAQALTEARTATEEWVGEGSYSDKGACVRAWFSLEDEESTWPEEDIEVDIEPNHSALIREAMGRGEGCGTSPDDHEWTSEGEGGCAENPGVWSTGGTAMTFSSHCSECGLQRVVRTTGSQRDPGDCDTVEYSAPEGE